MEHEIKSIHDEIKKLQEELRVNSRQIDEIKEKKQKKSS
jgi:hypothetical protein